MTPEVTFISLFNVNDFPILGLFVKMLSSMNYPLRVFVILENDQRLVWQPPCFLAHVLIPRGNLVIKSFFSVRVKSCIVEKVVATEQMAGILTSHNVLFFKPDAPANSRCETIFKTMHIPEENRLLISLATLGCTSICANTDNGMFLWRTRIALLPDLYNFRFWSSQNNWILFQVRSVPR